MELCKNTLVFGIVLILIVQNLSEAKSIIEPLSVEVTERVITNFDFVFDGAALDFRYNESGTTSSEPSSEKLLSSPGCPKSDEGYPWVYFGSPQKCYLAGQRGPCKEAQSIFVKSGSSSGFCNCDGFEGSKAVSKNEEGDQFCMGPSMEFVYMPAHAKCFTLYEQGPCKENEWLIKTTESVNSTKQIAKCEERKCPLGEVPAWEENKAKTNCEPRVQFAAGVAVSIPRNQCESDGMKYSELLQKCVTQFNFVGRF